MNFLGKFQKTLETTMAKTKQTIVTLANQTSDFYRQELTSGNEYPWDNIASHELREKFKTQILKLSEVHTEFYKDFLHKEGNEDFNIDQNVKQINSLLEIDQRLSKLRYQTVPKRISEMGFWQAYFILVEQIRESILNPETNSESKHLLEVKEQLSQDDPIQNNLEHLNQNLSDEDDDEIKL